MPDAPVLSSAGASSAPKTVKLDESAFGAAFHGPLVHQSVRAEQAARRRGTAATKTRAMVSGGGAKPWRQKGTGRARAGSSRSPLWTGGGVVFGPQPRSYTFKVNRKEQRAALRSALSLHAERDRLRSLMQPRSRLPRQATRSICSKAGSSHSQHWLCLAPRSPPQRSPSAIFRASRCFSRRVWVWQICSAPRRC